MLKLILCFCGWLSLFLGTLGIVLPLLPTTPFVLLAAWCFVKSSPRFAHWLYHHRYFGPLIVNWKQHRVIPARAKWLAGMMLSISALGIIWVEMPFVGKGGIWLMLGGIFLFIITRPSRAVSWMVDKN